jgi:hypothetical protein
LARGTRWAAGNKTDCGAADGSSEDSQQNQHNRSLEQILSAMTWHTPLTIEKKICLLRKPGRPEKVVRGSLQVMQFPQIYKTH